MKTEKDRYKRRKEKSRRKKRRRGKGVQDIKRAEESNKD